VLGSGLSFGRSLEEAKGQEDLENDSGIGQKRVRKKVDARRER
jgi:hypothetical protein